MDKIKNSPKSTSYSQPPIRGSNDSRAQGREMTRIQGGDPGNDPVLNDTDNGFVDSSSPTLEAMTTHAYETPSIGSVGSPAMPKYSTERCPVGYTQKDRPGG